MSRRQRISLPWAAREDSDAVFLFLLLLLLLGSPWTELYSVTTISLLSPFSSPRRCEYFSTDAQFIFTAISSTFHHAGRNESLSISEDGCEEDRYASSLFSHEPRWDSSFKQCQPSFEGVLGQVWRSMLCFCLLGLALWLWHWQGYMSLSRGY